MGASQVRNVYAAYVKFASTARGWAHEDGYGYVCTAYDATVAYGF